jgi:cytochrome c556
MNRWTMASLAVAVSASIALAAGADAIKDRRALMKANGEASKPIVPMMKGEAPFDLATVQKALNTYLDAANKMPALFPDDSKTGDTHALPAIWANKADVDARFKKFGEDVKAALSTIKDDASFKATMPGIFKNCGGCHEKYREKES